MNATNNNLIDSNYKSNQVAIEWRLLDKNLMILTTAIAKKATQQTDCFTSGRQVTGVSNTLFALAYFVPALASLDCETCLEILVENILSISWLEWECHLYGVVTNLSNGAHAPITIFFSF
jgi:hypothetical protein